MAFKFDSHRRSRHALQRGYSHSSRTSVYVHAVSAPVSCLNPWTDHHTSLQNNYFNVSILTGFLLSISNRTRVLCCFCLHFDTERVHASRARRTMRANERVLRKKPNEKRGCWWRWIVTRVTPADDWFFERVVCLFRWNASRLLSNGFYHQFVEIFSLFRCYVFFEFFKFPVLARLCVCIYIYIYFSLTFFSPVKIASVRLARKLDVYRSFVFFQIVFGGPGNGIFADQVTNIGSFERGFVREKWLPSKNADGH